MCNIEESAWPLSIRLIVEIRVALIMFYTPQLFVKKYYLKNEWRVRKILISIENSWKIKKYARGEKSCSLVSLSSHEKDVQIIVHSRYTNLHVMHLIATVSSNIWNFVVRAIWIRLRKPRPTTPGIAAWDIRSQVLLIRSKLLKFNIYNEIQGGNDHFWPNQNCWNHHFWRGLNCRNSLYTLRLKVEMSNLIRSKLLKSTIYTKIQYINEHF